MAAVLPEPNSEVIDDLHPAPAAGEDEELVDLNTATPAAAAPAAAAPAAPAAGADDDLPEEYRGKTPAQLAKMLRDAQGLIGRQGTELGDLRKTADIAIRVAAARGQAAPAAPAAPAAKPPELEDVDFFKAPKDAIAKAIAEHPLMKKIEATLGEGEKTRAIERATRSTERFNTAHPDAAEILADPQFRQWVGASRVRSALLQRAHTQFDFDAGDEVFGTWKALKGVTTPQAGGQGGNVSDAARTLASAAAAKKKAQQALNDAATPTGGNASPQTSAGAKKIYRRADVLKLMEENPARYEELAPEITQAYREGRVR